MAAAGTCVWASVVLTYGFVSSGFILREKSRFQASGCLASFGFSCKVYTLSVSGDRLIVGTAGRRVLVWDLRNMGYVQQRRESSLKYQTRCIRAFPNKQVLPLSPPPSPLCPPPLCCSVKLQDSVIITKLFPLSLVFGGVMI